MTERGGPAAIRLESLPRERFIAFRDRLAAHYARDKVESGDWSAAEAPRRARAELDGLLPRGTETGGHHLYVAADAATGDEVGTVWLAARDRMVWIYDIEVREAFRRRGYATLILQAVEERARQLGAHRVGLHVFGHNAAARRLYERAGYEPTSITMSKQLDAG